MSFPNHIKGAARVALGFQWGKASAKTQAKQRLSTGIDWFTQRMRSAHDAKGQVFREGTSYRANRTTHWQLVRSIAGRINQVDLVIAGCVWKTGSNRTAQTAIRFGQWAA